MTESNSTQVILTDDGLKIIKAQTTADNAASGVNNLNDSSKLGPAEKQELSRKYRADKALYNIDMKMLTDAGLPTTDLQSAMTALDSFITPYFQDMGKTENVSRDRLNQVFTGFDTADKNASSAFNDMISNAANDAKKAGEDAKEVGDKAQEAGEAAKASAEQAQTDATKAKADASTAQQKAQSSIDQLNEATTKLDGEITEAKTSASQAQSAADSALSSASSAVAKAESTASEFGKVSQKADSAFDNALSAQNDASAAVAQASSAAADSKDAKQIAGAVSQSYKILTDGSTMTIAELQNGLAAKLTKTDLDGYATQTWTQNQVKMTADGINGTMSSIKSTVDGQTTSINDLKADSSSFKSQFTTVNNTLGKQNTDIGSLQASSKELTSGFNTLTSDNKTNKNDISQLKQTATEVSSTLETVQTQVQDSAVGTNLLKNTGDLSSTSTTSIWNTLFGSSQIYDSGIKSLSGVSAMTFSFNVFIPSNANVGDAVCIQLKGQNSQATNTGSDEWNTLIGEYKYAIKQDDLGKTIRASVSIQKASKYQSFDTALADTASIVIRQSLNIPGFVYSRIKLEKGNVATDWCPNPADNQTNQHNISQLQASAETFNSTLTTVQQQVTDSAVGTNLLTNTDKDISITSHTTDGWPGWVNIDTGFSFEHGKTYTFSTEAKNSTDKIAEASIRVWESSTNTEVGVYALPADGERHSVTFTIPNDSHDYHLLLYAGHAGIVPGVDVTTTYHHPKLEIGSLSTDWCLSPADIATQSQIIQLSGEITQKVNSGDFSTYKTQTAELIGSKVDNGDFSTYKTQTANLIGSKVANSDFSTYKTQTAKLIESRVDNGTYQSDKTQTADLISQAVKKNDVVNQINISNEGILIDGKKVHITGNTSIDNAVIKNAMIANAAINTAQIADGAINNAKIANASIDDAKISNLNGNKIIAGSIMASSINVNDLIANGINAKTLTAVNLNASTLTTPELDLGLNGTFTEDFDYTQNTSFFLPKKNSGTLTFNHGVLQSKGNMQTYVNGQWGGMTDQLTFQSGISNAQGTELAPGYIKMDLYKKDDTVGQRIYADPTGYYYTSTTGDKSYLGNVLQTKQVQTPSIIGEYIGPRAGTNLLQLVNNGKDYGFQIGKYGGNEAIFSDFIHNATTSQSANVYITGGGRLTRSTSASKYKYNIKNPEIETTLGDRLLNVHMATWNDKHAVDMYAEKLNTGEEREKITIDKYYGLIAEQLRDAGLDMFVDYGKNHEIEGIQYDRAWIPLLSVVRRLNNKVNEYELRLSKLEGANK